MKGFLYILSNEHSSKRVCCFEISPSSYLEAAKNVIFLNGSAIKEGEGGGGAKVLPLRKFPTAIKLRNRLGRGVKAFFCGFPNLSIMIRLSSIFATYL